VTFNTQMASSLQPEAHYINMASVFLIVSVYNASEA